MPTLSESCGTNSPSLWVRTVRSTAQRVGKGAEKDPERDLVAPITCKVAKEARSHLPGG